MINGGANRYFIQGREILCREAGFLHGLCKGGNEECAALWFVENIEEGVVSDPNFFEEEDPPFPAPSSLFVCLVYCSLQKDSFSSSEKSHDTISDLRETILKLGGSCEGTCKVSNFIRFLSDKSISCESESDTSSSSPGNHCEYRQDLESIIVVASWPAVRNFAICSMSVAPSSWKFDFSTIMMRWCCLL